MASLNMTGSRRSTGSLSEHRRSGKQRADRPESPVSLSDAGAAEVLEQLVYIDTDLDRKTVCDVVDGLGEVFDHIPFAVCGVAAMVYYGYDKFSLNRVSILCPSQSAEVILCWARSRGMPLFTGDPNLFGFKLGDGRVCFVRVRTYSSGSFDDLGVVHLGPSRTPVLSIPCLVNQFAKDYIGKLDEISPEMQRRYAKDIMWMLDRMGQLSAPEQTFTPKHASWVLTRGFWLPFTLSFPEMIDAFSAAGLFDCFTDDTERPGSAGTGSAGTGSAGTGSSGPYAPRAWNILENRGTSPCSSQETVSGSTSALPPSSRTSVSLPPTRNYIKGQPDLNKPLPRLPNEAHQPIILPRRIYTKGHADLQKPLPPLPAEAFDCEPPVHSIKSFAARMLAKGKAMLFPGSAPRRTGVFAQVAPVPERKAPPKLRRVTQKLPDMCKKQVRFDSSADGSSSFWSSTSSGSTRRY
ncbi:hypothetical protein K4F52_007794 [Lecanicillium sp. MT-2017a]|nr:hypothetical protein K4F52_007794 [Lecanicillium sp. MT-2017a]